MLILCLFSSWNSCGLLNLGDMLWLAAGWFFKLELELGLQYEEYPPFHEVHNLYCTMPESRYDKPFSMKNFFARNKITDDKLPDYFKIIEERIYGTSKITFGKFTLKNL